MLKQALASRNLANHPVYQLVLMTHRLGSMATWCLRHMTLLEVCLGLRYQDKLLANNRNLLPWNQIDQTATAILPTLDRHLHAA
jgi:hypothetical protein